MKRIVSLILALVMCLSFIPATVSAASTAELRDAVLETAIAYYYHNPNIQYDSISITTLDKYAGDGGDFRSTDYTSPEMAIDTDPMYSVCSAYCFEVYFDAFGYKINGDPMKSKTADYHTIPADDQNVVYRWIEGEAEYEGIDRAKAANEMAKLLQPGDIITGGDPYGHSMLYVGDIMGDGTKYILHCAGQKINMNTGVDSVEEDGAIRLDKLQNYVLDPVKGIIFTAKYTHLTLLRPLNEISKTGEYSLTASAKGRLAYPRLVIDRQADYSKFNDVEVGSEITLTVKLTNNSKSSYTVPVEEVVPAKAKLVEGSATGGTVSGSKISWKVSLKAGETKTVSYTVKVTGKVGETVTFANGNVGGIKSNTIPVVIGGKHLTADQQAKIADIENGKSAFNGQEFKDTDFAEAVYKNLLGITVDLPTTSELLTNLYKRQRPAGAKTLMYISKGEVPEGFEHKAAMQVPFYFGGQMVFTGGGGNRGRILDFKDFQLQIGDVIAWRTTGEPVICYVYLGNGKLAYMDGTTLKTCSTDILVKSLITDYFVCLRPTLAYEDISAGKLANLSNSLPFTDVKKTDWFYPYVYELVNGGIVKGVSATSFAPNANLTYGAALKLLVVAVTGNDAGNATSGHWASNYLATAKEKGWISGEVNLDAPITRESFCEIAAKAKSLTKQPAVNPFKDTANEAVLALVEAKVINGMSADTFAPNGILNRAQITKIISLLLAL